MKQPNRNRPVPATRSRLAATAAAFSATLALSGCIAAVGNRPSPERSQTIGQELIDLDRAKKAGAINDAEYQRLRQNLIQ